MSWNANKSRIPKRRNKIQLLQTLFNLQPWYSSGTGSAQSAPPPPVDQNITTVLGKAAPAPISGNVPATALPPLPELFVPPTSPPTEETASVQSAEDTASVPLPQLLSGLVLPLEVLTRDNDTSTGDLARIVQRIVALGFTAVEVPFSFLDIYSSNYLPNLVRRCSATTDADFRQQLVPPGFPVNTLNGVPLPPVLGVVTNSTKIPSCNWYLGGVEGVDLFIDIIRVLLTNGLDVVVQNTDVDSVVSDPNGWISQWVSLGATLSSLPATSGQLYVSPLLTRGVDQIQWTSQNSVPGLQDLYQTVFYAVDQVLPRTLYLVEGLNGSDFTDSTTLLRQTQSTTRNGRIVPLADTLDSLTNFTSQFEFLETQGVCIGTCETYELAAVVDTASTSNTSSTFLSNSTWFALSDQPQNLTWDEVSYLTGIGLKPWYSPRSAYSPLPGQLPRATLDAQAAEYTDTPCSVEVVLQAQGDSTPSTAVVMLNVTNAKTVSVTPPYEIQFNSSSIQAGLQAFGANTLKSSFGSVTLTLDEYYDILWPNSTNSVSVFVVSQLVSANVSDASVSLAGLVCTTTVM